MWNVSDEPGTESLTWPQTGCLFNQWPTSCAWHDLLSSGALRETSIRNECKECEEIPTSQDVAPPLRGGGYSGFFESLFLTSGFEEQEAYAGKTLFGLKEAGHPHFFDCLLWEISLIGVQCDQHLCNDLVFMTEIVFVATT